MYIEFETYLLVRDKGSRVVGSAVYTPGSDTWSCEIHGFRSVLEKRPAAPLGHCWVSPVLRERTSCRLASTTAKL